MGLKEFFKTTSPVLVAMFLFLLVVTSAGASLVETVSRWIADMLRQDVVVLNLAPSPDLGEKAYVYISLMYPDGLRQIDKTVVDPGEAPHKEVTVNLKDLRKAWQEELAKNGVFAEPLIIITGFTRSGKVFVHGVEVFWEELPKNIKLALTPLRDANVLEEQSEDADRAPIEEARLKSLDGCKVVRYRVDEYEWTAPAVTAKVSPDDMTWGAVFYAYHPYVQVGFRVNVFVASKWTSAGFLWVSSNSTGLHDGYFTQGQEFYIWMNFKYRYEKWRVYGRCDETVFDYYEEYIYIREFYPETLSGGPTLLHGVQLPPVDNWIYEGRYSALSVYLPYYFVAFSNLSSKYLGIDVSRFINVLLQHNKISSRAAVEATTMGLIVSVHFEHKNTSAFHIFIQLYSHPGTEHLVYRAETVDYEPIPVLYIRTQLAD